MIEPLLQAERLLLHGMVEHAEQLYRRVAEQDPRNSIAVVGLARVALERGDDELALAHARAALVIDPENVAAVRLEARLREVLDERQRTSQGAAPDQPAAAPAATPPAATPPAATPPAAPDARPSEATVFRRNPSMAEHRQRDEQRSAETPTDEASEPPAPTTTQPARRRGLLDRLLRRHGGE